MVTKLNRKTLKVEEVKPKVNPLAAKCPKCEATERQIPIFTTYHVDPCYPHVDVTCHFCGHTYTHWPKGPLPYEVEEK
jgi:hypothetical protein